MIVKHNTKKKKEIPDVCKIVAVSPGEKDSEYPNRWRPAEYLESGELEVSPSGQPSVTSALPVCASVVTG